MKTISEKRKRKSKRTSPDVPLLFFARKLNCELNDRSGTEGLELVWKPFGGTNSVETERKEMDGRRNL